MICTTCGLTHNNPVFFHVKHNKQTVCLRCWLNELKQFAAFCKYWRSKVTSEHGLSLLQKILTETHDEIYKTEQKIETLRAQYQRSKT